MVHPGAIAPDDAGRFELAHPFGDRRLAEVHLPTQFGHGDAAVLLQGRKDAGIVAVDFGLFGHPAIWP